MYRFMVRGPLEVGALGTDFLVPMDGLGTRVKRSRSVDMSIRYN